MVNYEDLFASRARVARCGVKKMVGAGFEAYLPSEPGKPF
jgi:hypothetical protein